MLPPMKSLKIAGGAVSCMCADSSSKPYPFAASFLSAFLITQLETLGHYTVVKAAINHVQN
jgi:hypothetical protein